MMKISKIVVKECTLVENNHNIQNIGELDSYDWVTETQETTMDCCMSDLADSNPTRTYGGNRNSKMILSTILLMLLKSITLWKPEFHQNHPHQLKLRGLRSH